MSRWSPAMPLGIFAVLAILVSFFSASQDIVIDAWRRESFSDWELGLASSLTINGYRVGMLVSSSGALLLSATMAWSAVYVIMGLIVAASSVFTFFAPEPQVDAPPPRNFREAVVEPFIDYFKRPGAWIVLLFILCYKLGDNLASAMTMPMYLDLGFTKPQIAVVVKGLGIFGMITGGLLGGVLMLRWPLVRSLWIFGILQAVSTAGFAWLATQGPSLPALEAVIFFENFTAGMGTSAYAAYMGSVTNRRFSATQYALLSSLMAVSRSFIAAPSGYLVKGLGWQGYFIFCAVIAIPGMLLLRYIPFHDAEPMAKA
jgi:PAT family beta-lactamase induction signal transducer AmpG